jgi:hypothetical protein
MDTLNALLEIAKKSNKDYLLLKKRHPRFDERLIDANNANSEAIFSLYREISKKLPLVIVAENGEHLSVQVHRAITDISIFNYMDDQGNFQSYDLLKVDRFEAVEVSKTMKIVGTQINISQTGSNQTQINIIDFRF